MQPSCIDGIKNGDESAVDCGGDTCSACEAGLSCTTGSDCVSSVCGLDAHICAPPSCTDGMRNGDESDVDCGGSCDACGDDARCSADSDCASRVCNGAVNQCVAASCSDGVLNGDEVTVDCGGTCGIVLCPVDTDDPSLVTKSFVLVPLTLQDFPNAKRTLFLKAIVELMGPMYARSDVGLLDASVRLCQKPACHTPP